MLLVDSNDLFKIFVAFDSIVFTGNLAGTIQALAQGAVQDVEDQRRFSRPGYPCYSNQRAEREAHGDILEIVVARAVNSNGLAGCRAAALRDRDRRSSCQIISGERPGLLGNLSRCAGSNHLPAVL